MKIFSIILSASVMLAFAANAQPSKPRNKREACAIKVGCQWNPNTHKYDRCAKATWGAFDACLNGGRGKKSN